MSVSYCNVNVACVEQLRDIKEEVAGMIKGGKGMAEILKGFSNFVSPPTQVSLESYRMVGIPAYHIISTP